ncbi:anti-sigma factor [Taklimakanibacter lacteus]|uniref:anti-sigma factor n=1 Tax=Taklimakanibacter lacteus TaxID=2268456 RepID=UPI000E66A6F2
MALDETLEAMAGEYVLGTLSASERLEAQTLLSQNTEFAAAVDLWNRRLAPLLLAARAVTPPAQLRQRILASVGQASGSGNVVDLAKRVTFWRGFSLAASAVAAALALFILLRPTPEVAPGNYVAVLQPEGPGPAFVASIDLKDGTIRVKRLGNQAETGKSYELWAVGGGRAAPQSLGVIDASLKIPAGTLGKVDPATLNETVFAISLEPQGGSPTGAPTGPVLYTGKLVATE